MEPIPVHYTEKKPKEPGTASIRVRLEAYDPCPHHAPAPCKCPKRCVDIMLLQFAQIVQLNILDTAVSIKDTSGSSHSETANTSSSTIDIHAGTGATAAAYNDHALQTETETVLGTSGTVTVGSATGSGTTSSFTVSGTVTAGASRAYSDVGLSVTINSHVYLLCHDVFTALSVSNGGTLAITYTLSLG